LLYKSIEWKKANCSKIRGKNKSFENLDDGAILLAGENIVNDAILKGAFFILFNKSIVINNIKYINEKQKMLDYISQHKYNNYMITHYIFSNGSELSLDNINIINQFFKIGNTKMRLELMLLILLITFLTLFKSRTIVNKIVQQIQKYGTKTETELEIPESKTTTETIKENEAQNSIEITFAEHNNSSNVINRSDSS